MGRPGAGLAWDEPQQPPGWPLTQARPQGCGAAFSSLMGYQYHQRRCGKPPCEVDSPSFPCTHCGKTYRSKAGHDYHMRSEHTAPVSSPGPGSSCPLGPSLCVSCHLPCALSLLSWGPQAWGLGSLGPRGLCVCASRPMPLCLCACAPCPVAPAAHPGPSALQPPEEPEDKPPETEDLLGVERTPSGRIRRTSAQVAVFHLQEIAEDELARDWTKRRVKDDLVPETARVSCRRVPDSRV